MTQRGQAGLTFVELLMAVMIFSILAAGLSTHLLGAMRVWQTTTATVEILQQQRLTREWLAQDLANLVVVEPRADDMPRVQFGSDVMQFYTVRLAQNAASARPVVWCVKYQLAETPAGYSLTRGAQTIQDASLAPAASSERLLSNLDRLSIRYGALQAEGEPQIAWRQSWDAASGLPTFVEVTVQPRGVVRSPREFRRASAGSGEARWMFSIPGGGATAESVS